ncbi:MAG: FAD dependent oxidoreductase [uncultured Sulfurovum sp.]|uniref:FAD dependent oxidoreductase n=1 Tax=uncultured Sulfurovum sp. TaxID=269237 RepID=A0A6S6U182_9BACT|nr:MAG: FAD dependent oxidoreductase [uncultured Sulfurovum sp.]
MKKTYHTIIIGAGIAGASIAYALKQKGVDVLVIDKGHVASGGSGAAGAFVSPKIGKGSALQKLTNEAFVYAKNFYLSTCPSYFHQTGVIRIPKNELDAINFSSYAPYNDEGCENYSTKKLQSHNIHTSFNSFFFSQAGDCDAKHVCESLLQNISVLKQNIEKISKEDNYWKVGEYSTTNLVLATGYESNLTDLRYMGIRGTWGTRGDFNSSLDLQVSMHQSMSVGANINGVIKLGATHEKEVTLPEPCNDEKALELKEKASSLIDTSDFVLKESFCGMRAGSKDYFPLVGKVIDVPFMLETHPKVLRGAKPELDYLDNLYVLNGLGGRGFVFAPLMAKWLAEHIVEEKEIDKRVSPDRLFLKWCRKL